MVITILLRLIRIIAVTNVCRARGTVRSISEPHNAEGNLQCRDVQRNILWAIHCQVYPIVSTSIGVIMLLVLKIYLAHFIFWFFFLLLISPPR